MKRTHVSAAVLLLVCLFGGGICLTTGHEPVMAISTASAAENDEEVLAALREGCANAVSAIRSGSGQATVYSWSKGGDGGILETEAKDDLKFRGDRFLLRENVKYLRSDPPPGVPAQPPLTMRTSASSYDLEKVTILDQFDSLEAQARICDPTRSRGKNSINLYKTSVAIVGYGVAHLVPRPEDLPSFIELASVKVAGRETINGDECIMVDVVTTMHLPKLVELVKGTITQTVRRWVNPQKGYTIVKVQVWLEGSVYSAKTLVTEINTTVRQYETGVWGPEKVTYQQYDLKGEVTRKMVTTYDSAFKLNVPISDGDLTLTLPSGTKVHNELIDAEYTVP